MNLVLVGSVNIYFVNVGSKVITSRKYIKQLFILLLPVPRNYLKTVGVGNWKVGVGNWKVGVGNWKVGVDR